MKEHYVSYSQAVKIKELGFDWEVCGYYTRDDNFRKVREVTALNHNDTKKFKNILSAPRLDQAAAWLREAKGIDIEISAYQHLDGESIKHQYKFGVLTINGETFDNTWCDNYEQALSDAIDTALELLGKDTVKIQ